MEDSQHFKFMSRAIKLARRGQYTTHPNPRVGCILVKDGQIIGEGFHQRTGEGHAEVNALNDIKTILPDAVKGATAYVTLEPCSFTGRTPPCSSALINAGVSKVVIAIQDPNPSVSGSGIEQLKAADIEVISGILEAEARALNPGFIHRMEHKLPFVRVKMATSLDGRTALVSGESKWITGEAARRDVQFWRAKSSAILTGIGTVLADDPSLTVRLSEDELNIEGEVRQPVRVILDSQLRCPVDAKLLGLAGKTLIYTQCSSANRIAALESAGAEIIVMAQQQGADMSLRQILEDLAKREINEIHTEAGAKLCGNLMQQGLVNELLLYMAPHLLGCDALGAFHLPQLQTMQDRIDLKIKDVRAIGDDWRIIASLTHRQV